MEKYLIKHLSPNDLIKLLALSHQSLQYATKDQLSQLVLGLRAFFPFENAVCAQAKIPDAFTNPDVNVDVLDISYPADYMQLYFENNLHLTDAVVCDFLTDLSPVNWLKLDQQLEYNYPASVLALDYNMREGWSHGTLDLATMNCTFFSMGGPRTENNMRAQKILGFGTI